MAATAYEQLGGAGKVRVITDALVERMRADLLIGFFFARVDVPRLQALEFAHAAAALGGPEPYVGRALAEVHRRLPIQGGHFDRRVALLAELLRERAVPAEVAELWLAHTRALRQTILGG